jgi:hypothetical protein
MKPVAITTHTMMVSATHTMIVAVVLTPTQRLNTRTHTRTHNISFSVSALFNKQEL